jgi:protoporphyrinogen oxidase
MKVPSRREFLKSGGRALLGAGLAWNGLGRVASAQTAPVLDAVVVGAGIAGLTAGYYLRDRRILILEKDVLAGGRARAARFEGLPFPVGVSYMGKPYGALKEIIESQNLDIREVPAPLRAYAGRGGIVTGVDGLAGLLAEGGAADHFDRFRRAVLDTARDYGDIPELNLTPRFSGLDDVSAARWLETNKMPAAFHGALDVMARGLFGTGVEEISALSFIPEIAFALSPDGAYTFDRGLSEVTDALARLLTKKLRLKAAVTRVVKRGDLFEVSYKDPAGGLASVRAKFVVLAVPAPVVRTLAPDVLTSEQKEALAAIPYAAMAFAALFSREAVFNRAYDLAMPGAGLVTGFCDSSRTVRRFDPSAAARKAFVLGATFAGRNMRDRAFLEYSDEALRKTAVAELAGVLPDAPGKIVGGQVFRFPQAYPVMVPGAYKRLIRLNEITDGRLQLAGDYMIYPSFEAAADSGDFAAEKIKELM